MFKRRLSKVFFELYKMFKENTNFPDTDEFNNPSASVVRRSDVYLGDSPITIKFHKATGGLVVQVISMSSGTNSTYNTISSGPREDSALYIIEHGKNIGEELEKIITVTQLSR